MQALPSIVEHCFRSLLPALLMALLLLPAAAFAVTPTATPPAEVVGTPEPGAVESTVNDAAESVAARTPIPTPTAGILQQEVVELTENLGLDDITFLGLSAAEWIDLVISVLIFLLSYWAIVWFVGRILRRAVRSTKTQFDDRFFASIERELKWLLGILLLRFSVLRLTFITDGMRTLLDDAFFLLSLLLVIRITVKMVDFSLAWYESYLDPQKRGAIDPVLVMLKNAGKLLVYVTGAGIALSHFDLVSNAILIVLVVVGVVVLLSIKDIMTDIIYGFIILVGQPFRVGDAIRVEGMHMNDWGWVHDIGSRETHIQTRDNRMLVIPNAALGSDQVVNYMAPDPAYRVGTDLHLAYEADFDKIQPLVAQTTRSADGVLPDKPVEVMLWHYGRYGYTVRVRWWLANCEQDQESVTGVNAALKTALDAAGIRMGHGTVDLHVDGDSNEPSPPSP